MAPTTAKALATLQAEAALHYGATIVAIDGDDGRAEYVVVREAVCRRFRELTDVRRWLASCGADEVSS